MVRMVHDPQHGESFEADLAALLTATLTGSIDPTEAGMFNRIDQLMRYWTTEKRSAKAKRQARDDEGRFRETLFDLDWLKNLGKPKKKRADLPGTRARTDTTPLGFKEGEVEEVDELDLPGTTDKPNIFGDFFDEEPMEAPPPAPDYNLAEFQAGHEAIRPKGTQPRVPHWYLSDPSTKALLRSWLGTMGFEPDGGWMSRAFLDDPEYLRRLNAEFDQVAPEGDDAFTPQRAKALVAANVGDRIAGTISNEQLGALVRHVDTVFQENATSSDDLTPVGVPHLGSRDAAVILRTQLDQPLNSYENAPTYEPVLLDDDGSVDLDEWDDERQSTIDPVTKQFSYVNRDPIDPVAAQPGEMYILDTQTGELAVAAAVPGHENDPKARFIAAEVGTPEGDTMLRDHLTGRIVGWWAETSNDSHAGSLAIQQVMQGRLPEGTPVAPWDAEDWMQADVDWIAEDHSDTINAILDAQQAQTLALLDGLGWDQLRITRGLAPTEENIGDAFNDPEAVRAWIEGIESSGDDYGMTTAGTVQRPLSSWSRNVNTAAMFAGAHQGEGKKQFLLSTVVPKEEILATTITGVGAFGEEEVVPIARLRPARVLHGITTDSRHASIKEGLHEQGRFEKMGEEDIPGLTVNPDIDDLNADWIKNVPPEEVDEIDLPEIGWDTEEVDEIDLPAPDRGAGFPELGYQVNEWDPDDPDAVKIYQRMINNTYNDYLAYMEKDRYSSEVAMTKEELTEYVANWFRDKYSGQAKSRAPMNVLAALIVDKVVKTQFESETSKGAYDPRMRVAIEKSRGVPEDLAPHLRPVYGWIPIPGVVDSVDGYGELVLTPTPNVDERTTVTGEDSLSTARYLLEKTAVADASTEQILTSMGSHTMLEAAMTAHGETFQGRYLEAQIHGGLPMADVASIEMEEKELQRFGSPLPFDKEIASIAGDEGGQVAVAVALERLGFTDDHLAQIDGSDELTATAAQQMEDGRDPVLVTEEIVNGLLAATGNTATFTVNRTQPKPEEVDELDLPEIGWDTEEVDEIDLPSPVERALSPDGYPPLSSTQQEAIEAATSPSEPPPGWKAERVGTGASEPYFWTNTTTGEKMLVKKPINNDPKEVVLEEYASKFLQNFGLGATPEAQANSAQTVAGAQFAHNSVSWGSLHYMSERRKSELIAALRDRDEILRIVVADLISGNSDRNNGNLMIRTNDDGTTSMVPVDHGTFVNPIPGDEMLLESWQWNFNKSAAKAALETLVAVMRDEGSTNRQIEQYITDTMTGLLQEISDPGILPDGYPQANAVVSNNVATVRDILQNNPDLIENIAWQIRRETPESIDEVDELDLPTATMLPTDLGGENNPVVQPIPTRDGGTSPVINVAGRPVVVVDVGGVKVPFYLSSGQNKKKGVSGGQWYPFFGIANDGPYGYGAWFNKTTGLEDYYNNSVLRDVAERLDAQYGDIRDDSSIPSIDLEHGRDEETLQAINQGMEHAPTSMPPIWAGSDVQKNRLAMLEQLGEAFPGSNEPDGVYQAERIRNRVQEWLDEHPEAKEQVGYYLGEYDKSSIKGEWDWAWSDLSDAEYAASYFGYEQEEGPDTTGLPPIGWDEEEPPKEPVDEIDLPAEGPLKDVEFLGEESAGKFATTYNRYRTPDGEVRVNTTPFFRGISEDNRQLLMPLMGNDWDMFLGEPGNIYGGGRKSPVPRKQGEWRQFRAKILGGALVNPENAALLERFNNLPWKARRSLIDTFALDNANPDPVDALPKLLDRFERNPDQKPVAKKPPRVFSQETIKLAGEMLGGFWPEPYQNEKDGRLRQWKAKALAEELLKPENAELLERVRALPAEDRRALFDSYAFETARRDAADALPELVERFSPADDLPEIGWDEEEPVDEIDLPEESPVEQALADLVKDTYVSGDMAEAVEGAMYPGDIFADWDTVPIGNGASQPYYWTNPDTGERMIVKKGINDTYEELEKEVMASDVFRAIGLPAAPHAQINNEGMVVAVTHASDAFPGGTPAEDWGELTPEQRAAAVNALQEPWDAIKLLLGDVALTNSDRNTGNLMIGYDAAGNAHLVPIDHGETLQEPYPYEKVRSYEGTPALTIAERTIEDWDAGIEVMKLALDRIYNEYLEEADGDTDAADIRFGEELADRVSSTISDFNVSWSSDYRDKTYEQEETRRVLEDYFSANWAAMERDQQEITEEILKSYEYLKEAEKLEEEERRAEEVDEIDLPEDSPVEQALTSLVEDVQVSPDMAEAVKNAKHPSDAPEGWDADEIGEGASAPYVWTDYDTGKQMIVKRGIYHSYAELEKEVMASDLFRAIGLPATPDAQVNDAGEVVAITHASDAFPDGTWAKMWDILSGKQRAAAVNALQDPWDAIKLLLGDTALGNPDRNPWNLMIGYDAAGNAHLVPIDHGEALKEPYVLKKKRPYEVTPEDFITEGSYDKWNAWVEVTSLAMNRIYNGYLDEAGGDEAAARERLEQELTDQVGSTINDFHFPWSPPTREMDEVEAEARRTLEEYYDTNVTAMETSQPEIVQAILDMVDRWNTPTKLRQYEEVDEIDLPDEEENDTDLSPVEQAAIPVERDFDSGSREDRVVAESMADAADEFAARHNLRGEVRLDSDGYVYVNFRHPDQGLPFLRMEREIIDPENIINYYFAMDSKDQGQGYGTELSDLMEDAYARAGVQNARLRANMDVGGYAWAKQGYGWDFGQEEYEFQRGTGDFPVEIDRLHKEFNRELEDQYGADWEDPEDGDPRAQQLYYEFEDLVSSLQSEGIPEELRPTPLDFARLGREPGDTTWLGKRMMLNTEWHGIKKMQSPQGPAGEEVDEIDLPSPGEGAAEELLLPPKDVVYGHMEQTVKDAVAPYGWSVRAEATKDGNTTFTLFDENLDEVGFLIRKLKDNPNGPGYVMDNTQFHMEPEYQGQGAGSAITAALRDLYRKDGVARVELRANMDVGAYAWAKNGFDYDWDKYNWDTDWSDLENVPFNELGNALYEVEMDGNRGHVIQLYQLWGKGVEALNNLKETNPKQYLKMRREFEEYFRRLLDPDPDDLPTSLELAAMGRTRGAKSWFGKDVLTGVTAPQWFGVQKVSPAGEGPVELTLEEAIAAGKLKRKKRKKPKGYKDQGDAFYLKEWLSTGVLEENPEIPEDQEEEHYGGSEEEDYYGGEEEEYSSSPGVEYIDADLDHATEFRGGFDHLDPTERSKISKKAAAGRRRKGTGKGGGQFEEEIEVRARITIDENTGKASAPKTLSPDTEPAWRPGKLGPTPQREQPLLRQQQEPGKTESPQIAQRPSKLTTEQIAVPEKIEARSLPEGMVDALETPVPPKAGTPPQANPPQGWKAEVIGEGQTQPHIWVNETTGERMIVKPSNVSRQVDPDVENLIAEEFAAEILQTSIAPQTPSAYVNENKTLVGIEHASDVFNGAPVDNIGTRAAKDLVENLADPDDPMRINIFDLASVNNDRHSANVMTTENEDGKLELIPIDHGEAFRNTLDKSTFQNIMSGETRFLPSMINERINDLRQSGMSENEITEYIENIYDQTVEDLKQASHAKGTENQRRLLENNLAFLEGEGKELYLARFGLNRSEEKPSVSPEKSVALEELRTDQGAAFNGMHDENYTAVDIIRDVNSYQLPTELEADIKELDRTISDLMAELSALSGESNRYYTDINEAETDADLAAAQGRANEFSQKAGDLRAEFNKQIQALKQLEAEIKRKNYEKKSAADLWGAW